VPQSPEPDGGPVRVVVAHATAAGRLALRMLVENEPGLELAAETASAVEAGRLARGGDARFVVLHDALLDGGRLGILPPSCALVLLGLEPHPAAARASGAHRYVRWDRASEDLPPVLHGGAPHPLRLAPS
jgi:hypothetical protein